MQTTVLRVVTGAGEAAVPSGAPFVIGRAKTADFVINDNRVSRKHLVVEQTHNGWIVRDISSNGTWVEGQRVQSVDVHGEVRLRLGTPTGPEVLVLLEGASGGDGYDDGYGQDYDMQTMLPGQAGSERSRGAMGRSGRDGGDGGGDPTGLTSLEREHQRRTAYRLRSGTMSIGRGRNNDVVISDLLASRNHAELYVGRHGIDVVDLDSANGTFVNGQRINRAPLGQGSVIAVGHHVFQLEGDELVEYIDSGDVSFEADGLNVFAGQKQLMHDMTFRLPGRALLGVVGPSGAGKSTLLNALTGFRPADTGSVRYAGRDMYSEYDELRRRIGYVPQEDLLHTSLTVRKALEFGAELRFPPDTTKNERRTRVDEVLGRAGPDAAREHPGVPAVGWPAQADVGGAGAADPPDAALLGRTDLGPRPGHGQERHGVAAQAGGRRPDGRRRHAQRRRSSTCATSCSCWRPAATWGTSARRRSR